MMILMLDVDVVDVYSVFGDVRALDVLVHLKDTVSIFVF